MMSLVDTMINWHVGRSSAIIECAAAAECKWTRRAEVRGSDQTHGRMQVVITGVMG
jgi:hypothetical protein